MDDKKINLLPEDLRAREDRSKRPLLHFSPDFKRPGKKVKAQSYKPSGSQVSWWSKLFQSNKAKKTNSENTVSASPLAHSISYNNSDQLNKKITPLTMPMPESLASKVEEHIQDFVPAQAKIAKPHGPSFWSKLTHRSPSQVKPKTQKIDSSALSNGLKYNGQSTQADLHQPAPQPDMKVFQDLNKQAEETDNFNLKSKKINDQVSVVAKSAPVFQNPIVKPAIAVSTPVLVKPPKSKGLSWWAKFLVWFGSWSKDKKNNDLSLGTESQNSAQAPMQSPATPELKAFPDLNKQAEDARAISGASQKNNDQINQPVMPEINFDLTKKVSEEIGLAPLQPIAPASSPAPLPPASQPASNGFSLPEYAPTAKAEINSNINTISAPEQSGPKVTGPQFHIPEASQKNSLLNGRVDLIPIAARVRSWKQIGTLLGLAIVLSLAILGAIYGYLVYAEQRIVSEQNQKKEAIAKIEKSILDFADLNKNINTLGQEIKLVQDALSKHIYWTNFFDLLEKYTVNDVFYSGLAVGTNGGLTLSASTNSYDSVAKQLKVLNSDKAQEFAQNASIMSAKQDKDGTVSFQIILTLNQSLFYYRQAQ